MNRLLGPLRRRIQMMVARAVVSGIADAGGIQALQIEALEGETLEGVERMQDYGFTSVPHPGAEAVVVFAGGTRSHGLVVALGDRRYRLRALQNGEVAIYDDLEQRVHLTRDGVVIESALKVNVTAPQVEVSADHVVVNSDSIDLGGAGGRRVARIGDTVAGGVITGGSTKVRAQ